EIYKILGSSTTLDDVLNNQKCLSFSERAASKETHGTTVEIECDGEPQLIKGHEFNRLYQYTDPVEATFRDLIVEHCPVAFPADQGIYAKIHQIYKKIGYVPTALYLDGAQLERRLPANLSEFDRKE